MSESKFKTMRHIEAVRNFLNTVIKELLYRQENHDQTKLQSPEAETFEEFTHLLRGCTFGSEEYLAAMEEMRPVLDHHYFHNRHHPEYFTQGSDANTPPFTSALERMSLIDLIEMMCDWKAASLRHDDGDVLRSIEVNKKKFGFSDELEMILINTANFLNIVYTPHKAIES